MKIKPLADRIIVQPKVEEEKTASGIIIPDTARERVPVGTVLAVGNGKKDEPLTVKVGDEVVFGKHSGVPIEVEGNRYLLLREADVFAVI
jgi:chaperonin GroES